MWKFLYSYLKNGHHFIQCICDDKHIRTKAMNLKGLSDYSEPFQFDVLFTIQLSIIYKNLLGQCSVLSPLP